MKEDVEYVIEQPSSTCATSHRPGRADQKPVDVDLEVQESPGRIWSSRHHAVVTCENGTLAIENLNSSNGAFVNRVRVRPGRKLPLQADDVIQSGEVQMKVVF